MGGGAGAGGGGLEERTRRTDKKGVNGIIIWQTGGEEGPLVLLCVYQCVNTDLTVRQPKTVETKKKDGERARQEERGSWDELQNVIFGLSDNMWLHCFFFSFSF